MASAALGEGIGTLLGALIAAYLRGGEEKRYQTQLQGLSEDQQRQLENERLQMGTYPNVQTGALPGQAPLNPPGAGMPDLSQVALQTRALPPPPPPAPPMGFLDRLRGIPGQIAEGLTPSSPEIDALLQQYGQRGQELQRAQSMTDALTLARLQGKLPLSEARTQELLLQAKNQLEQRKTLFEQQKALKAIPQAVEPSFGHAPIPDTNSSTGYSYGRFNTRTGAIEPTGMPAPPPAAAEPSFSHAPIPDTNSPTGYSYGKFNARTGAIEPTGMPAPPPATAGIKTARRTVLDAGGKPVVETYDAQNPTVVYDRQPAPRTGPAVPLPSRPELSAFQAQQAAKLRDSYVKQIAPWQGVQEMAKLGETVDVNNANDVNDLLVTMVRAANSFDTDAAKGRMTTAETDLIKLARSGPEALQSWWYRTMGTGAVLAPAQVTRIQTTLKRMATVAKERQGSIHQTISEQARALDVPEDLIFGAPAGSRSPSPTTPAQDKTFIRDPTTGQLTEVPAGP